MKDSILLKPTKSLFSLFQPTVGSRCYWQYFLAFVTGYYSGVGLSSDCI